ncbi:hypothetical protein IP92_04704 [Pseudoduganella flava]|uniref:Uncharacterized protein n=1 Tax=Pseudoduganella flava TaxID=871742 RepID=A0A562PGT4_9BURK|nr:hypothetical protein [Pseudoduganella flava]QGZ42505.1 hypothetical protein GO485_28050 [Pseudoduganella flava]TWI43651.1 hypothetical protein IP92_04704 [Pseudoduganella flava]
MNTDRFADCRGRLDLLADLNAERTDVFAAYDLERLPAAADLEEAVGRHFELVGKTRYDPPRDYPAATWHITLEEISGPFEHTLHRMCERWFFRSEVLAAVPLSPHRENVVNGFLAGLVAAIGNCRTWRVHIAPQCWYGIEWDHVAFEAVDGRYMLSFMRSD